jgi:hypothetical protein
MKTRMSFPGLLIVLLLMLATSISASEQVSHVRWDIISLNSATTPPSLNPGGFAEAKAPDNTKIKFTGSGTFVAQAGEAEGSRAVTGGGTWQTFSAAGASTGSGTYTVEALVIFVFANLQSQTPAFIDNIGDIFARANGTAVLKVEYSDGDQGILVVGCHGPGAPAGISEGVSATKGFKTFDQVQPPQAGVDANRTIFHIEGTAD